MSAGEGGCAGGGECARVSRTAAHEPTKSTNRGRNSDPGPYKAAFSGSNCCTSAAHCCTSATLLPINPRDYEKDEPEPVSAADGQRCGSCRVGEHISATTVSRRRSGRRWCSPSRGCSTTGRLSGQRSNSAAVMSAGWAKRSIARGRRSRRLLRGFLWATCYTQYEHYITNLLYNDSVMFQRFVAVGDQPIQCWKQANR